VASLKTYREDVDCLRAVAVLSVIGFHWQIAGLSGGYVGVDVFFVISGYLITKLIAGELFAGTFSFANFYLRRARRILPALYATVFVSAVVGWFVLLPPAMLDFGRSAVSVFLFASNILFWREAGYFDQAAATKPLLHTWSLSVEEQFYLVVPALLWGLVRTYRERRSVIAMVLIAVALLSFALSCWQTAHTPSAAFYLSPGRAWEFILGSGLLLVERKTMGSFARIVAFVVGTAMIVAAALTFGHTALFPGPAALLPCLGTALIVWANVQPASGPAAALLHGGAFVGRISYSLYLWHWPVYAFARVWMQADEGLSLGIKAVLAIVTLALSLISYATIEQPFRARLALRNNKAFVAACVASALAFAGLVVAAPSLPILTGHYGAEASRIAYYSSGYLYPALYRDGTCFLRPEQGFTDLDRSQCFAVDPARQNILLWGDSMAAHYLPGLTDLAAREHFNLLQATASLCPPIFGVDMMERPHCHDFNDRVGELMQANRGLVVLLSADWPSYDTRFGTEAFLRSLRATVKRLNDAGVRTIVFGPPIRWRQPLPALLAERVERNAGPIDARTLVFEPQFAADRSLRAALPGIPYISILDTVCPSLRCPAFAGDVPLSLDRNHLTKEGSILVIEAIGPQLESGIRQ
jgi:peptidoglycan/LPS O-acetylase OafA/YrhL